MERTPSGSERARAGSVKHVMALLRSVTWTGALRANARAGAFLALLALVLAFAPQPAEALQAGVGESDVVDRVVAFVGDSAILRSQIDEEIERMRVVGSAEVPEAGPELEALRAQILDTWVNLMLILVAADLDSLVSIPDEVIEEQVTQEIDNVTQRFGGQARLQQALAQEGLTLAEYREMTRSQIAQQQIRQAFLGLRLRDAPRPSLSEEEVLEAFEGMRGSLEQRPKLITFRQVVIAPNPSDSALAAARAEARDLRLRLLEGAPFDSLATEHSDDPGSAAEGGDLGWFRRGGMVQQFDETVFSMVEEEISDLVETRFGFHIIRLDRIRPGERRARHILVRPETSAADMQAAADTADLVADEARAGAQMEELFERYSDPEAPDSLTVPAPQLSSLPPGYSALEFAASGDVLGPVSYRTAQGDNRFAVIKVIEVREAGAYTFDDLRTQISEQLVQERQIEAILEDLRARTHVEILNR